MGGIVKGIEGAVSGVVGGVSSAMNAVTDGVAHLAGGVAGGILGKDVGDIVEKFAHIAAPIALTAFTGGIGGIFSGAGALGEAGAFAGPLQAVIGGGAQSVASSLVPNLGSALTSLADSGSPFGSILVGLTEPLG